VSATGRAAAVIGALLVATATASAAPRAAAQTPGRVAADVAAPEASTGAPAMFGRRPDRRRIIPGMWALHPYEPQFPELDWTRGFGAQVSHWFVATFVNSYDARGWVGGLERYWLERTRGVLTFGVGYRVGVVTGYDERLFELARHTPVLPFVGLLVWGDAGPIGVDVFYVYRAITFEGSLRF
jgi:hypothetical protein